MAVRPKHRNAEKPGEPGEPAIGGLLVAVALLAFSYSAWGTHGSAVAVAWMALVLGLGVMSMFGANRRTFWPALLGGGLLVVHGIVLVVATDATAPTLTVLLGVFVLLDGVAPPDVGYRA